MPRDILTGFFGKLPTTGDFVTRGLPSGLRSFWDGFCSAHLARRDNWPEGGLRFRLASGGRAAAAVVQPGQDSAGRRFPLAAFLMADTLPPAGSALEGWLDAAATALASADSAEALWQALDNIPPPEGTGAPDVEPTIQLWTTGHAPVPLDPAAPGQVLDRIFAPLSSG